MLNAPSKHAIQALMCLAKHENSEFVPVKELAEESRVPFAYLSKIVKSLSESGLVQTRKGARGGVMLKRGVITFYEVCESLADPIVVENCFLSSSKCNSKNPCPFHESWSKERKRIFRFLKQNKIRRSQK